MDWAMFGWGLIIGSAINLAILLPVSLKKLKSLSDY